MFSLMRKMFLAAVFAVPLLFVFTTDAQAEHRYYRDWDGYYYYQPYPNYYYYPSPYYYPYYDGYYYDDGYYGTPRFHYHDYGNGGSLRLGPLHIPIR